MCRLTLAGRLELLPRLQLHLALDLDGLTDPNNTDLLTQRSALTMAATNRERSVPLCATLDERTIMIKQIFGPQTTTKTVEFKPNNEKSP